MLRPLLSVTFLVTCAALSTVGCNKEDLDEVEKPPLAFEGKPEPKFAATWKTPDGNSTYQFADDGKYILDSLVSVKGQSRMKTHSEGEWKVNGDRMLFRDQSGNVVPYAYEMKDKTLTLTLTGSMKNKTVLNKQ
jgi:hypothetical protein